MQAFVAVRKRGISKIERAATASKKEIFPNKPIKIFDKEFLRYGARENK